MSEHRDPFWRCPALGCRIVRYAAVLWIAATLAAFLAGCDRASWVKLSEEMEVVYNSEWDAAAPDLAIETPAGFCTLSLLGPEHRYTYNQRLGPACNSSLGTKAAVDYLVFAGEPGGFHPIGIRWTP